MQKPHGGHRLLIQNCLAHIAVFFGRELLLQIFAHEIHVAVHRFYPRLAPARAVNPPRVRAVVHKLPQRVPEIFFALFGERVHFVRHIAAFRARFRPLVAVQNVRLRGLGEIHRDQGRLNHVLNFLNTGRITRVELFEERAHDFSRYALRIFLRIAFLRRLHRVHDGVRDTRRVKRHEPSIPLFNFSEHLRLRFHK